MLVAKKELLVEILDTKPWINEEEASKVTSKIEETMTWLDSMVEKQSELALDEDPAFTSSEVISKTEAVTKLFKKVTEKKKPREKKSKKNKKDESKEDDKKEDDQKEESNSTDEEFADL